MPLIAIIAISTWISLICAGSRVNSGSIRFGRGARTTKSTQSPGMSTRGSARPASTISLTCAITMPPENAVASTIAGVSSVFGPVNRLPSASAACAATSDTCGVRSMK